MCDMGRAAGAPESQASSPGGKEMDADSAERHRPWQSSRPCSSIKNAGKFGSPTTLLLFALAIGKALAVTTQPGHTSPGALSKCTISFQQDYCDTLYSPKRVVCSWYEIKPKGRGNVKYQYHQLDCRDLIGDELPASKADHEGFHYQVNASSCHSALLLNNPTPRQRTLRVGCLCRDGLLEQLLCTFDVPAKGCGQPTSALLVEPCEISTSGKTGGSKNVTIHTGVTVPLGEPPTVSLSHVVPSSPPTSSSVGTNRTDEGSSNKTGMIVGIPLGIVGFTLTIILIVTCWKLCKKQPDHQNPRGKETWKNISRLSKYLSSTWKQLGDELSFPAYKQTEVERNNPHDVVGAAREMLLFWYENLPVARRDAAIDELRDALIACDLRGICSQWLEEISVHTASGSETNVSEERSTVGEASSED